MATDFRREWVKKKALTMLGLEDEIFFNAMLERSEDLEEKLSSFLEDDIIHDEDRQIFCIYKTSHEKLVEEEIMVAHKGKSFHFNISFIYNCFIKFNKKLLFTQGEIVTWRNFINFSCM